MIKNLNSKMRAVLCATAAIVAFAPICVHADDAAQKIRFTSAAADTPAGAAHLYALIKQAADAACGTSDSDSDVIYRHGSSPCVKDTMADAVRRINSSQLSQLYIKENGVDRAAKYGIDTAVRTASR